MEVKDCAASPVLPAVRADDIGRPLVPEAALPGRATDFGPARQSACALRVVLAKPPPELCEIGRQSRLVQPSSPASLAASPPMADQSGSASGRR